MRLSKFIQGLQILQQYYKNADGYHLSAERNEIKLYATDTPLPDEDVKKLRELGWFQLCEWNNCDQHPSYAPEDSWMVIP